MSSQDIRRLLSENGLKITPQRVAVLDSFQKLKQHPTTDQIIAFIRKHHPNIASGTVYKTLDTFVEKGLLKRVKTDRDVMRYDPILTPHHHMYDEGSGRIEDYFDEDLNALLTDYFNKKDLQDFKIREVILQIKGRFIH